MSTKDVKNEKEEPYISVVIACYNSAPYLPKLFETLHEQTWHDFEVVVVNDGGTDNTPELVEELSVQYPELTVRYVYTPNGGVAHCRNVGLDNARGTYLCFCDGDDYFMPGGLEALAKEAQRTNADRILAEKLTVSEDGKVLANQELPKEPSTWNCTAVHGNLMRRAVFEDNQVHWKEGIYSEDVYMSFTFSQYCKKVTYVRVPTYCWVMHKVSVSSASNSRRANVDISEKRIKEILGYALPILRTLDGDAREHMEYELIKLYAFLLFRDFRYAPLKVEFAGYKRLQEAFQSELPQYRKNRFIYAGSDAPMRHFTRRVIACLVTAERLHMAKLLLVIYHLVAKIYTFQV